MATGREFWQEVLAAGGFTAVPRWVLGGSDGRIAKFEVTVPVDLRTGRTALIAAHLKVIAALSGDRDVVTGYVPEPGAPLPLRVSTDVDSWDELLDAVRRTEREVLAHKPFDLDTDTPPYEIELDLVGVEPARDTVLSVGLRGNTLMIRYRTDVVDASMAERIAGYHLTALQAFQAGDWRRSLLSADELSHQIDGFAGPHRDLPDARFHELFERRVREHPDAVAAVHGGTRWSYARTQPAGQPNRPRPGGPRPEPRGRRRRRDRAESGLDGLGAGHLQGRRRLSADRAALSGRPDREDPEPRRVPACAHRAWQHVHLGPGPRPPPSRSCVSTTPTPRATPTTTSASRSSSDQFAYIYFTSGSTGEPKGAMCEHAGMLNHLYAKIDDLGIEAGSRWSRRPRRSASTSRCGSWSPRCWSAGGR